MHSLLFTPSPVRLHALNSSPLLSLIFYLGKTCQPASDDELSDKWAWFCYRICSIKAVSRPIRSFADSNNVFVEKQRFFTAIKVGNEVVLPASTSNS